MVPAEEEHVSTPSCLLAFSAALLALGLALPAWGELPARGGSIYACIDAKGRRLSSDRPIPECLDREQKELNNSGTVRRTIGPSMNAEERAAFEERERKLAEERQRQLDERRANRALLTRYPNQAAHDAERVKVLEAAQDVIAAGQMRVLELQEQARKLEQETEFYKSPAKWPPRLRRQLEENQHQMAAQRRFVDAQEEEKKRIATRLDEELARLKVLWAQLAPPAAAASGAASASAAAKR
jgi:hypothetical protein